MRLSGLLRRYRCNLPVPKVTGSHRFYNALNRRRARLIAWATSMPTRAEQVLAGINLGGVTLDRLVSTLSGGQKTKLTLARLLFQSPDLLLLDEPTNFLDVEATAWLMDLLDRYPGALLIISHDLDLLARGINKVLRLNEFTHKLEEYRGTYSNYLTLTGDALALLERTKAQQEREISRLRKTSQKLRGYGATRVSQRIAVDKRIAALEASRP